MCKLYTSFIHLINNYIGFSDHKINLKTRLSIIYTFIGIDFLVKKYIYNIFFDIRYSILI